MNSVQVRNSPNIILQTGLQARSRTNVHSRIHEFTTGNLVYVSTLGKLVPGVVSLGKNWLRYVQSNTVGWSHRYLPHRSLMQAHSDQVSVYHNIQLDLDTDKSVPNFQCP